MNTRKITAPLPAAGPHLRLSYLRRRIGRIEQRPAAGRALSLGDAALDAALPWNGLTRGSLHEFSGAPGDAAASGFAAGLLARLTAAGGVVLWCRHRRMAQEHGTPYGPGLARFGLATSRLILTDTDRPSGLLWAMEEALRCSQLAAIVGEGIQVDLTASRRLQLAAETGGTIGFLLPPPSDRSPPTAAASRWRIAAAASVPLAAGIDRLRWRVALLHCRGGGRPQNWEVEWDDETLRLGVVPALADRPLAAAAQ